MIFLLMMTTFYNENIEYVEALPHDSEFVSLETAEIVIPKVKEIEDDNLREKLLNVHLLIANIEALKDNPTPSFKLLTKSSSTSLNSFLEETNTFYNSLPEFENFYFDLEEISSGSTTTHSYVSLSEYDSFIFDLANDQFPPTDRSNFTHEEFSDELAHIISPPKNPLFLSCLFCCDYLSSIPGNLKTLAKGFYPPSLNFLSFNWESSSQPMLKSSYKAYAGVIISILPLVRGVADVVVEIKGTEIRFRRLEYFDYIPVLCEVKDKQEKDKIKSKPGKNEKPITNSGKVPVNTANQSSPRAATSTSTARSVNTAATRLTMNGAKPVVSDVQRNRENIVKSSACWIWRATGNIIDRISKDSGSYMVKRFNYVDLQGRLKSDQGIFDSGCSRHMTGNKSFLTNYQEIDGGFVAFGGSPKGDHLGKFEGKADDGFLVGYSVNSKAFRVFNSRTGKVEENMHIRFLENKSNVVGRGIEINVNTGNAGHEKAFDHEYILLQFIPSHSPLSLKTGIFDDVYNDREVGAEADTNNLELSTVVSPIPTIRVHKDHPKEQIIRDLNLATQTRRMINFSEENAMVSFINKQKRTNHKDYQNCLFACFLSQQEPKKVIHALTDPSWIEAMQEELLIEAIRLFLAYASYMGFIVYQMDVKSAFLYGTIEEEVYVCQPPGFEDTYFPNKVYKVEKALYGLHQAHRAWYGTLFTYLLENRFRRGTIDKTLFMKKDGDDILLVQVYVNYIIFGSTKKSLCDEFEQMMHKRFQISSIGELIFILGLQAASTQMEPNKALIKDAEAEDIDVHLCRSMIGSLMYLTSFKPNIMFAFCACLKFQVTSKTSHLDAVKRIFRYLKCQPKLDLWYPRDSPFDLEAFSDSDYAGASFDMKYTIR
nr:putative ribonuclease H-like domain-containing protein [Tanacetum cinerariifolium]